MTTSVFVDTSGWAESVSSNGLHRLAVAAHYRTLLTSNRPLVTTNHILAELLALLTSRSRAQRRHILDIIRHIRRLPQLRVEFVTSEDEQAAWAMIERYLDKQWSLVDAASFVVMRRLGIAEALTTDRHFEQAGFLVYQGT